MYHLWAPGQRQTMPRMREASLRRRRQGESAELLSSELGTPIYRPEQCPEGAQAAIDAALRERGTGGE
ncbi:MAG: hypothetical protein M0002_15770 [Rhodospirillales bacterium]|nr:hypothetical protein [Rhodospirillales bacterium]